MAELTKEEQVQAIYDLKVGYTLGHADIAILKAVARQLLAGIQQEPVAQVYQPANIGICAPLGPSVMMLKPLSPGTKLYAAPQLPQPAEAITQHFDTIALDTAKMVMCDVNRRDEFLGGDIQLLSRIQCRIDEACRAAMLQGAEPVQANTLREGLAAIRNLGPIDAGKIQAERDALNEPDVPDGYALVPVEPTVEMVAAAMLSDDVLFDQDDDTMFRVQHGVIWRAMLAAAPDFREISNSSTKHFRENAETSTKCWCHTCRPVTMTDARFVVCHDCGNKRCPHANDHRNACTGSNEPGQEGSAYPAAPHQEVATDNATQQFMSLGLIVTSDERKMELPRCSKHPETELQVHPFEQLMSYPPQPVMYCPLCRPSVAEWVEFDKQLRQWKEVK